MARDRKRAKQRQRKRGQGQQQQRDPKPQSSRIPGVQPEEVTPVDLPDLPDQSDLPEQPDLPDQPDLPERSDVFEPQDAIDPPGPLGQAAPEAELAELAEAGLQEPGAPIGRPLEEKDYPHPDELEGADVIEEVEREERESRRERRRRRAAEGDGAPAESADAAPARRTPSAPAGRELPKEGNRFINFLRACVAELRRVQWPDRRQVGQATAVVLVFVVIAGGYLGLLDALFSRLVDAIL